MKLEDQVCSLELAKKLKELGVRQESAFHWAKATDGRMFLYFSRFDEEQGRNPVHGNDDISALTVAELGEMLPTRFSTHKFVISGTNGLECWLCYPRANNEEPCLEAKTEADARAKMLIHLIENGIIEAKRVVNEKA